ncbi:MULTISPECIES: PepSY domain-containing protein [unclassified Enterococcus]|uniref:PepSY domain-containing protein n=1 Tax=unclassified Enterococcus TaxID=2608891 RepID=UPI001CE07FBB|nr:MULTISPECIES: PepSY domain-containing protein [unclassified Enterococcus]MCA5014172.1 PepSY domain-containing protein [Enterococcus sp. S23]MCA5017608.1 PepSY domain-containing protein [Enterococcus sp. S22(2020)]
MNKKIIISMALMLLTLGACANNNKTETGTSNLETKNETSTAVGSRLETIKISLPDAIAAFEEIYPSAAITSIDLEDSLGSYSYKIQGIEGTKEFDIRVDADSGEVTKEREEKVDRDDQGEDNALDLKDLISLEEATEIAEGTVKDGEAIEWSLEKELATTYWEITIKTGLLSENTVKINAQTGDVLEQEQD